jgi:hypothetical protein
MYVALGEPLEPIFQHFQRACQELGEEVRLVSDLGPDILLSWRFDSYNTSSTLQFGNQTRLGEYEIKGVFVQRPPSLDVDSNLSEQSEQTQAEKNAVMYAWFWSLVCPVINRYPPAFWFAFGVPLAVWQPLIVACGLKAPDTILSNSEGDLRDFASDFGGNVCYSPFSGNKTYRIVTKEDWLGLNKMRVDCPVNLISSVPPVYRACVVGQEVIWNQTASGLMRRCEGSFKQLAAMAGLDFLEICLMTHRGELRVQAIEAFPKLRGFSDASLQEIAKALAALFQSRSGLLR